jgi:hypothetical protein
MPDCYVCKKELVLGFEKFVGLCLKHNDEIDRKTPRQHHSNVIGDKK